MNSLLIEVKRFFKNKNTVTIFLVVFCLALLYFAYNYRIKKATEPQSIPYALKTLEPRTKVTADMVGTRKVPGSIVAGNVITNTNDIIGHYVSNKVEIPKDSIFYKNSLLTWDELPSSLYEDIPEGNTIVYLPVDMDSTYGNSIFEGNYIDLYFKGTDNDGKILIGKFIESIQVKAVTDSSFNNIFEKSDKLSSPAYLIFSVPEDMHLLLRKAMYVFGEKCLIPVPRNAEYSENPKYESPRISSVYLQNLILSKTVNYNETNINNSTTNNGGGN